MAIQLAGFAWLVGVISTLLLSLVELFGKWFTKKIAVMAAALLLVAGAAATFFGAVHGLIAGLSYTVPPEIQAGIGLICPPNMAAAAAVMAAVKMAAWVYSWHLKVIQMRLFD